MELKESETVELKKSTSELKEGIISIVAILNKHSSGVLLFGIDPKGKVVGQQVSETTIRNISQKISNSIEPKIFPEIKKKEIEGKDCIAVYFKGYEPIYYMDAKAYIRVGDEDRRMSAKEIEKRVLSKSSIRWDAKVSERNLRDINEAILRKYIEEARRVGRISFGYSNKKTVLNKLELIKGNKLLNAAQILFCDNSSLEVQLAIFASTDKTTFLDIKDKTSNLFGLLDFSESYIKEHINWKADLSTSTRKEIPEIPIRAITEALVNSFCHRDYTAPESNKIAIYKDRIEIWNPGDFPEQFRPEDFIKKDLPSILRNPKIAKILYYNKKIEKWGTGIKRIYEECKENSVNVDFKTMKYGFKVIFYRKPIRQKSEAIPKQILSKSEADERQRWILEYLNKNIRIKAKDIESYFSIHRDTAVEDLNKLVKDNKIIKKGAGRNIWYELKRK
ncbi:transcriptional regulator [Candidatus Woesearchaeota archaeon]|nr:transcriptional regulator [Candidatus Woesearchaeota archaeon]|tara:strand:- start:11314 stop:12657 length:1344 start_codon:yes stop_codon:yes gene_type:complete